MGSASARGPSALGWHLCPTPAGSHMGAVAMVELEVASGCSYVSLFSCISIRQVDATIPGA